MSQDFALLYMQLGLHPDCSLEDLKRAYRVRVAELHPDRHLDQSSSNEEHRELTELTALYSGAIRFHRIHGRLPGATPRAAFLGARAMPDAGVSARGASEATATQGPSTATRFMAATDRQAAPSATPRIAVLSVLVLVVVMVVLHWSESGPIAPGAEANGAVAEVADPDAPRLELGMEEAAVVAIQGPPERVQDDVWNYGSSWVRFEEGHVVDWASMPPNRLMTPTPRPVLEEEAAAR